MAQYTPYIFPLDLAVVKYRASLKTRDYHLDYKHIRLSPSEAIELDYSNKMLFIICADYALRVESADGMAVYDLNDERLMFLAHEHEGSIRISNRSTKDRVSLQYVEVSFMHL